MQGLVLRPLKTEEREDFIKRNQASFNKAVIEQDPNFEGEIIPREDILRSLNAKGAEAFNIVLDDKVVGGTVVVIDEENNLNSLDLLFLNVDFIGKGVGFEVWQKLEKKYPKTKVWQTHTPYFEKRNIHFYVNKCGFHIVEFFNEKHPEPYSDKDPYEGCEGIDIGFFKFEKKMNVNNQ